MLLVDIHFILYRSILQYNIERSIRVYHYIDLFMYVIIIIYIFTTTQEQQVRLSDLSNRLLTNVSCSLAPFLPL